MSDVSAETNRPPNAVTCPATYNGAPCVKRRWQIDREWLHGGGHMFMTEAQQRRLDTDPDAAREFLANARTVPKEAIVNG